MLAFRTLRARLSALYAGLFVAAMLLLAAAAQVMISRHASETVRRELAASGLIYDRLWSSRTRTLGDQADVLARDFGFRSALASGDAPTIASAASNLNQRAGTSFTAVVTPDRQVIGALPTALRHDVADLPYAFASGRGTTVIGSGGMPYQIIVRPVLAPVEIGWIVFAVRLDRTEMGALEKLSAIPLKADVLWRDAPGTWHLAAATAEERATLPRLATPTGEAPRQWRLGGEEVLAVAKPLAGSDSKTSALLIIRYPVAAAMAGFRPLQASILLAALLGLAFVVAASLRLARSIARPISELEDAARLLAEGERVDVPVRGEDEIARLAQRFNSMAGEIVEREHRISHMALNDALTNLPNRTFFREQLDAQLRRLRDGEAQLAILSLDLDGFKHVNDTLGHPFGDKLLVEVSRRLTSAMPDSFVARLGGDEFAIICSEEQVSEPSMRHSRKLIEAVQKPFLIDGQQALIGTSIGIAIAPSDGLTADALLKNADLALYRAKQDGRGVFRFFEPALNDEAQTRRQLEIDLREALLEGQFELHFQPIYATEAQQVVCFEALLRWNHPRRGMIGPDQFVRVAEESGLMLRIGEWVLQEACRRAHEWPENIRVAVNVSPMQFRNPALNRVILQALANGGVAAQRLELEITESIFLDNSCDTAKMLHRLRKLGVRISLDDFGTGYSSLSYLRTFPFDKIKIDKSFVDDIGRESSAAAIVQAIVDLANALGMETTAEGVEHEDQFQQLRAQGCSSIQGYLLGRPVNAAEATALAHRGSAMQQVA
jgi:diguanylate cyclase (GGDEF)-like protein